MLVLNYYLLSFTSFKTVVSQEISTFNWIEWPSFIRVLLVISLIFFIAVIILLLCINGYIEHYNEHEINKDDIASDDDLLGLDDDVLDIIYERRENDPLKKSS